MSTSALFPPKTERVYTRRKAAGKTRGPGIPVLEDVTNRPHRTRAQTKKPAVRRKKNKTDNASQSETLLALKEEYDSLSQERLLCVSRRQKKSKITQESLLRTVQSIQKSYVQDLCEDLGLPREEQVVVEEPIYDDLFAGLANDDHTGSLILSNDLDDDLGSASSSEEILLELSQDDDDDECSLEIQLDDLSLGPDPSLSLDFEALAETDDLLGCESVENTVMRLAHLIIDEESDNPTTSLPTETVETTMRLETDRMAALIAQNIPEDNDTTSLDIPDLGEGEHTVALQAVLQWMNSQPENTVSVDYDGEEGQEESLREETSEIGQGEWTLAIGSVLARLGSE